MEFKIVDDIDISKEELDYFENHDFGEEMREALENGTAIVSEGNWDETVKAMKAKMAANATKAITIRVPVRVIERYKKRAAAAGIGYQTLMKQMLEAAPV
jgi:predicted DNA binding CopG/RHH family protein